MIRKLLMMMTTLLASFASGPSQATLVGSELSVNYNYPVLGTAYGSPGPTVTITPGGSTFDAILATSLHLDFQITDTSIRISDFAWDGNQSGAVLGASVATFNGIVLSVPSGDFPSTSLTSVSGITGLDASDISVSGNQLRINLSGITYQTGQSEIVLTTQDANPADPFEGLGVLPGGGATQVSAISSDGTVVGGSRVRNGSYEPVLWKTDGSLVEIGFLPGGQWGEVRALSSDGNVAIGVGAGSDGITQCWKWSADSGVVGLGTPGGNYAAFSGASEDCSAVLGMGYTSDGQWVPWRWTADTGLQPFTDNSSEMERPIQVVSKNASAVAGNEYTPNGLRIWKWTVDEGVTELVLPEDLTSPNIRSISQDGKVLTGTWHHNNYWESWRWTKDSGFQFLGLLREAYSADIYGVSADGNTIVGTSSHRDSQGYYYSQAWAWTPSGGLQNISPTANATAYLSLLGISDNGIVLLYGYKQDVGYVYWRWSSQSGLNQIPNPPNGYLYGASAISRDGSTISGYGWAGTSYQLMRWTQSGGTETLGQVLAPYFVASTGVILSYEGNAIAGSGNLSGQYVSWRWVKGKNAEKLQAVASGSFEITSAISRDGKIIAGWGESAQGRQVWRLKEGGTLTRLGCLPNGHESDFVGMSSSGDLIAGNGFDQNNTYRAWYWTEEDGMQAVPLIADSYPGTVQGVTENGTVYGEAEFYNNGWHYLPWIWTKAAGLKYVDPAPSSANSYIATMTVSQDGSIIVGREETYNYNNGQYTYSLWYWKVGDTQVIEIGVPGARLETTGQLYLANDGNVLSFSAYDQTSVRHAYRWASGDGVTDLGTLDGSQYMEARAVSGNGSIVVGSSYNANGPEIWRWTAEEGLTTLAPPIPDRWVDFNSMSRDGSILLAFGYDENWQTRAWRWTRAQGFQELGEADDADYAYPQAMSEDGRIVSGYGNGPTGWGPWRWTENTGLNFLVSDYGFPTEGWSLEYSAQLSADGSTMIGSGMSPHYYREGWRATFRDAPKQPVTVQWGNPQTINVGTPLDEQQLNATASVPGRFIYNPPAGTVLDGGSHILSVHFVPTDKAHYQKVDAQVSLTVLKATPQLSWANPADILYGETLSSEQLNATASIPGTFTYSPPADTVLQPGTQTLSVTFTPDDVADFNSVNATVQINVIKPAPPTLTLPPDITTEAENHAGANVSFTASAVDFLGAMLPVTLSPASGSAFAIGTTAVTVSAKDEFGQQSGGRFNVTVQDTTPPAITTPSDIVAEATSAEGAKVSFNPTASDLVDGDVGVIGNPISGSTFPIGETTVNLSATDTHGNAATASFKVTVQDTSAPTIKPLDNLVVEATGPEGAVATFTPSARDTVDGTVNVEADPASGATFPLGTTTVHLIAADQHGNQSASFFTVTVQDTTAPAIQAANLVAEATGPSGAVVSFNATAVDLVDGPVPVSYSAASGSTFPVGATVVTVTATDSRQNIGTSTFTVTVKDSTPPAITVPADIITEATGPNGAAVQFTTLASDIVDGTLAAVANPASGSTFGIGQTTVTVSAVDAHGNSSSKSFVVTVRDTTAPAIKVPADIIAEATGPNGASVQFATSANDLVDGSVPVVANPASGSVFGLGTTIVTVTAKDAHGNVGNRTFNISVRDTTPPVITSPADIIAEATGPDGATVTFNATASDVVDGNVPVNSSILSGNKFSLGSTTVVLQAADAHGNISNKQFMVTVRDTIAPSISCPNVAIASSVDPLVAVTYPTPVVSDAVDTAPRIVYSVPSGSGFAAGTTIVTCTATDASGNSRSTTFTVTRDALQFTGFLSPVGGADSTGGSFASPVRTFKMGSTVPVKFTASSGGSAVLTGAHKLQAVKYSGSTTAGTPIDATPQDAATTGNQFQLESGEWHFNLDTKTTGMSIGIWQLIGTLSDGSQHTCWIQLK
jgi:hypothetical protein